MNHVVGYSETRKTPTGNSTAVVELARQVTEDDLRRMRAREPEWLFVAGKTSMEKGGEHTKEVFVTVPRWEKEMSGADVGLAVIGALSTGGALLNED